MSVPPNEPNAVTAMVLGILGLAVCGVVAPFAWSIGKKSLDSIQRNPGMYGGEGMARAGYVMGIIGSILLIVAVVVVIFYFVIVASVIGGVSRLAA